MTPEEQLARALRAQASAQGRAGHGPRGAQGADPRSVLRRQITVALTVALVAGVLLGVGIALVSLLAPGVLPTVG